MARIPGVRADGHAAWLWLLAVVLAGVATWLWGRSASAPDPAADSSSEGVREDDFVELEAVEAQFGLEPVHEEPIRPDESAEEPVAPEEAQTPE